MSEHLIDLLSELEFQERFLILNDVSILLVDGEPTPTEKLSHNAKRRALLPSALSAQVVFPFH